VSYLLTIGTLFTGKLSKFKFIVKHYVKTWIFACDILSSLPIEVFCLFIKSDFTRHYAFGVLKLNRLLKFYRVSPFRIVEPWDLFPFCFSCDIVYLQFAHNSLCLFHSSTFCKESMCKGLRHV